MSEKKVTITAKGISQKQWSTLILELNIMRKAWAPFGPQIKLDTPGLKRIVSIGTSNKGMEPYEPHTEED